MIKVDGIYPTSKIDGVTFGGAHLCHRLDSPLASATWLLILYHVYAIIAMCT